MHIRPLGVGGPPVTSMGLGLAALGRPGYMTVGHADDMGDDISVQAMRARCHQMLDHAWAAGIRYVDCARSYGRAEEFLRDWLVMRDIAPGEVTVGSKWGYIYTAGWKRRAEKHEIKVHTVDNFLSQWAESRALLKDHLSVYMIHSATLKSGVLDRTDVHDAMQAARQETGVRMGLSLSGPRQAAVLRRALDLALFDVVQATWNPLDPSVGEALQQAKDAGMGVIIKESVANGRLTPRDRELSARAAAAGWDAPLDALAISTALAQPFCDVVLSGAATPTQLASNLTALHAQPPQWAGWSEQPEEYWSRRGELAWS
ncbi:MAG: aldo/keto reductase [Myxococcota bacterium]